MLSFYVQNVVWHMFKLCIFQLVIKEAPPICRIPMTFWCISTIMDAGFWTVLYLFYGEDAQCKLFPKGFQILICQTTWQFNSPTWSTLNEIVPTRGGSISGSGLYVVSSLHHTVLTSIYVNAVCPCSDVVFLMQRHSIINKLLTCFIKQEWENFYFRNESNWSLQFPSAYRLLPKEYMTLTQPFKGFNENINYNISVCCVVFVINKHRVETGL